MTIQEIEEELVRQEEKLKQALRSLRETEKQVNSVRQALLWLRQMIRALATSERSEQEWDKNPT